MNFFVRDKGFYKQVANIAIPIALQSMITMGVNLLDNIMVGSLGETAMSGVSNANQFLSVFHICCMGLGMGVSVLTARYWGMENMKNMKKAVTIMLRLCVGLALIFMIPAVFAPKILMKLYTPEQDVILQGVLYYRWIWPAIIMQGLSLTCTIVLRSVGQIRLPLYTSIGAFFINMFFNYIFIFGKFGAPRMEVQGAALGTLLARLFEFILICGFFFFKDERIEYRVHDIFMKSRSLIKEYTEISIPVFISDLLLALGNTAVAMVMGRIGKEFVAANSITMVTQQLSTVMIQGICQAGSIITSHTLGRGEQDKAHKQAWTFLSLGVLIGLFAGIVIRIVSNPVISLYNITDDTKEIAKQLMSSVALIVVFQSTNSIMMKGVLRGGGDTKFLMVADILFLWMLSIPLGGLAGLVLHLPAYWIYFFLKIDQIIKVFWCVIRLKSGKWIKAIN